MYNWICFKIIIVIPLMDKTDAHGYMERLYVWQYMRCVIIPAEDPVTDV